MKERKVCHERKENWLFLRNLLSHRNHCWSRGIWNNTGCCGIVGTGIEWAYFIAFISILICYIPQMVTISVLPAPFTFYMHTTRLVHPTAGYMLVIFGFNYVFILSALAGVFAEYASVYIPVDHRILGVGRFAFFRLLLQAWEFRPMPLPRISW